jgi:hypothetical protein
VHNHAASPFAFLHKKNLLSFSKNFPYPHLTQKLQIFMRQSTLSYLDGIFTFTFAYFNSKNKQTQNCHFPPIFSILQVYLFITVSVIYRYERKIQLQGWVTLFSPCAKIWVKFMIQTNNGGQKIGFKLKYKIFELLGLLGHSKSL